MIKALIFDFDGLIIDTESIWFDCFKEVMASEYQHELSIKAYSTCIGTSNHVLYDLLKASVPQLEEEKIEELASLLYQKNSTKLVMRPGVLSYLKTAKELGLKIGLASSSGHDWVVGYLKSLNIFDYFEAIVTREDVEQVKPDPALYMKALMNLDVLGEETIAFEDSIHGSQAAIKAGINCVVVPNPVTMHMNFTDFHLHLSSMEEKELTSVIEELEAIAKNL
ncbi:HAD family hydrolase [Sutcliffiella halmapala]|uniref:HAD family hydrolase n=1 Tax=Sutcliffiella halmapala TaxID=79882 RepID=UPI0009951EC5|nr:HAD family hydrolase [Sutcliffiella halmapala]